MRYRRQLRSRIIVSFLVFGAGLTALFAGTTLVVREWLEEELIESTLQREVDKAVDLSLADPTAVDRGLPFSGITGEIKSRRRFAEIPFDRQLETGVYDIEEPDPRSGELRSYKLAVRKTPERWGFMQYDVTEQRRTRSSLTLALLVAVGAFSALSLVIAFWLSRRVLRPVTDLAQRVASFDKSRPEPLAPHFTNDEVGQLANALDDYARRLTELVERDREFNANVSHELRTPLAVIRGATELLMAQELPDRTKERIRRIDRAARQSTELTEALLLLSRGERGAPSEGETSDVSQVVEQVVETQRTHIGNKPVTVSIEHDARPHVAAPASVLAVALANLIGNAFKYTQEGTVVIRICDDRVVVQDSGPGVDASEAGQLFERGYRSEKTAGTAGVGLGLAIVRRLCDLYRWRVSLEPGERGGAVATLIFR